MILQLKDSKPFAMGGNRLCFVHPEQSDRCVKVRRPDFSLEDLRRSKGFPKSLRPLSSFDDNAEEFRTIQDYEQAHGKKIYRHLAHYDGFENTDLGKGLVSELIRDSSGKISCSLKQYIIEEGLTDSVQTAIDDLCNFWQENRIASRKLLPHNVVVQQDASGNVVRLVVIDGLGDPNLIPLKWLPQTIGNRKVAKNIAEFQRRIRKLCDEVEAGKTFSSKIGKLLHDGTSQQSD